MLWPTSFGQGNRRRGNTGARPLRHGGSKTLQENSHAGKYVGPLLFFYAFIRRAMCVTYHVNRKQWSRPLILTPTLTNHDYSIDYSTFVRRQVSLSLSSRKTWFVSTSGDK